MNVQKTENHLQVLENLDEFKLWRDEVVRPKFELYKIALKNSLTLDEIKLKAILLAKADLEEVFYDVFEEIRVNKFVEEQAKKK